MRRLGFRQQRTLANEWMLTGHGLITGRAVGIHLRPAPPDSGLVFLRTDRPQPIAIPALVESVTDTRRRTTLGHPPAQVTLVEHVLSALAGLRIDNATIEISGAEPPGLDGSAWAFVEAIWNAGVVIQPARREIWTVTSPIIVTGSQMSLSLYPACDDELRITYRLDYGPSSSIVRQSHTIALTPDRYRSELAACRTFLLEAEALELKAMGIGSRLSPKDILVFGAAGPIQNPLRFANEPARHKVLDIVGDLALFGHDLRGHVIAYRSGHAQNIELVQTLRRLMVERGEQSLDRAA